MKPAAKLFAPVSLTLAAALSLSLSFAGCSTVREGTVISKRERPADPDFQRLGPTYAVEIEGTARNGQTAHKTVLVSEQEWSKLQIGDRFVIGHHREETKPLAQTQPEPESQPSPEKKTEKKKKVASEKAATAAAKKHAPAAHPAPSAEESPSATETGEPAAAKKHAAKIAAKSKQRVTQKAEATASPSASPAPSIAALQASPKPAPTTATSTTPTPTKPAPTTPAPQPQVSSMNFEKAQVQALEDPRVRELKAKIHSAGSNEEQHKAANDYYRALYGKMRELAPAAKDRIDKEEAAKLQNAAAASPQPSR